MEAEPNTFGEESRRKFHCLASKFTSLVHGRSEGDRQQINTLFDDLNALDFKTPVVSNSDKAVLIINQCCSIVSPNDTFLVAKGCQLISNLINKQHVKMEGKTLPLAIRWCTQSLKYCRDIAMLDILQALEALLRGNGSYVQEQMHELIGAGGILTSLVEKGLGPSKGDKVVLASPWEVQLMALMCFESLTFVAEVRDGVAVETLKFPDLQCCARVFIQHLYADKHPEQDEMIYCKMLISSLRGLRNILQLCPELQSQLLGEALGSVKTYMLYGLHGFMGLHPQKMFPANLFQCDVRPSASRGSRGGKIIRVRKRRQKKTETGGNRNAEEIATDQVAVQSFCGYTIPDSVDNSLGAATLYPGWMKTSDSDFSDTEAGQAAKTRNSQARVRQAALMLLFTIAKVCERKVFFGYWSSLLPDAPNLQQVPTLCTCLLKDPSPRSRMLVLQVLTLMLVGSHLYLSQAEKSCKTSLSFTPFSVTVGNMVTELHHSLLLVLSIENSIMVITLLLKCLAALVQNTPYHRLEPGLISKVVAKVKPYLRHKDVTIQVSSLTVFGSIVAVEPSTVEITNILMKCSVLSSRKQGSAQEDKVEQLSNQDSDHEDAVEDDPVALFELENSKDQDNMSWLVERCLCNLGRPSDTLSQRLASVGEVASRSVPVRIESLQVLTVLARKYFVPVMNRHLATLVQVLGQTLNDSDTAVAFHSGRVIDALGSSIMLCLQERGDPSVVSLEKSTQFWQVVLSGPLISLMQNAEKAMLRTVGCDCLATVGMEVFEQLPRDKQILIITLLFGCASDEEAAVRASAVRALAVCVMYPTLKEDIHFMMDTADCVMRTLQDESLLVRTKASWSLGNLSDALVLNSTSEDIEDIPSGLLQKLMETSIKASQDNDKVRSNAVRAVGNFLRLVSEEVLVQGSFKDAIERAISILVKNASTGSDMKVRWNACYAIGNMLRNSALYADNFSWQNVVFGALSKLVQDVRNFKVRINAALALAVPSCRQHYGPHYIDLWTALLNALDNSQNMEDFSEYKHRDNLLDQICITLSHLASLATKEDLTPLHDVLSFHLDTLQQHLLKFHERVVPEKSDAVNGAASHASSLLQLPGLSPNQHNAAALLLSIFLQDTDMPL